MKSDLFTEMGDIFNPSHNQEYLKHKQPPKPSQRVNWKGNDACVRSVNMGGGCTIKLKRNGRSILVDLMELSW
jgi:hypothetical protein